MWHYGLCVLIGLVAGFASALLGIGGGVIMVPMLILLFSLAARSAMATSLAYIAPVALYGALKQWHMGQDVKWLLVLLAVPAGLAGAELGSRLKAHVSDAQLRVIFAVLMIFVGIRLGFRGWRDMTRPAAADVNPPAAAAQPESPESENVQ